MIIDKREANYIYRKRNSIKPESTFKAECALCPFHLFDSDSKHTQMCCMMIFSLKVEVGPKIRKPLHTLATVTQRNPQLLVINVFDKKVGLTVAGNSLVEMYCCKLAGEDLAGPVTHFPTIKLLWTIA
jgi:hypothetical protein